MLIGQESTNTKCPPPLSLFVNRAAEHKVYWIKKQAVSDTMLEGIIHESFVEPLQSHFAFAAYESGLLDPLCGGTA
jgi:hypothetical protein